MNPVNSKLICGVLVAMVSALLISQPSARAQVGTAPSPSQPDSSLQGVVRDSAARPIAGVVVSLERPDKHNALEARTEAEGLYRFTGLTGGLYTLHVKMPGYVESSTQCTLEAGESKKLDLTLQLAHSADTHISEAPQFFDEPHFTLAGVTDTTNLGGHGSSGTMIRTRDSLATATASLNAQPPPASNDAALEMFLRELVQRQPQTFEANYQLGKLLVDEGKAADAFPYLETASRLKPGDYANAYELARACARNGDYRHAQARLLSLLSSPTHTEQDQGNTHHLLGEVDEKLGEPLEAVREYQRAAESSPSEENLFDWGSELLLHHAAEPAIEVFTQGSQLFPTSVRMLTALGASWYAAGSDDKATQSLCRASDLDPKDPNPYLFIGKIQATQAIQSPAIADKLERFAKLEPENALANYYYAVSLWKRRNSADKVDDLAEAKSLLLKAVRLDPKLAPAYLQLGLIYAEYNPKQAIAEYQLAIATTPNFEEAHYRLAQAYRQAGESSKARAELKAYEKLAQENAQETARRRREVQEFVYQMRQPTPTSQPQ